MGVHRLRWASIRWGPIRWASIQPTNASGSHGALVTLLSLTHLRQLGPDSHAAVHPPIVRSARPEPQRGHGPRGVVARGLTCGRRAAHPIASVAIRVVGCRIVVTLQPSPGAGLYRHPPVAVRSRPPPRLSRNHDPRDGRLLWSAAQGTETGTGARRVRAPESRSVWIHGWKVDFGEVAHAGKRERHVYYPRLRRAGWGRRR